MFIQVLQIIAAVGTILTGLFALIKPADITGFTGIRPEGGRGITEVRAIFGGVFIALGFLPFFVPAAYTVLGVSYLVVGLVRAVSMFLDKSVVQSNVISLAVEIIFGIILVIPA
jgi:hypothetical protein